MVVLANYYEQISKGLLESATKKLKRPFDLIAVPGVFEIPVTIGKNIKKYDGFIALGCVIRGETPHFDFISKASIDGIMKLSIEHKKPIGNGISNTFILEEKIVENLFLKKNSSFSIYIYQMMREENLLGIKSIGVLVEKN